MSSESNTAADSNPTPNGSTTEHPSLESDISRLTSLLLNDTAIAEGSDLAELLAQLDSADGMANGVETRLDSVLEKLDTLLEALERNEDGLTAGTNVDSGASDSSTAQTSSETKAASQ
ncbi:hypothetical protein SERLA73DRAFT_174502 [Serpula lacrymans var. lacrymans S7.3]|uniref:Uncharacterized protein n=1 Tax=Serpula lacrymans var. lacrymans (strain S7.3) TaxID=936435 RepID=F8PG41_SERL3|nr:hypothetical protein SERLA73DRAFT_174502 [Serpula lacrymans var. lacrymans S7.3]